MDTINHKVLRRTLIVTSGHNDVDISQHLQSLLKEWGIQYVVAVLPSMSDDDHFCTEIDNSLQDISRLEHRINLHALGNSMNHMDEIMIWSIGDAYDEVMRSLKIVIGRVGAVLGIEPIANAILMMETSTFHEGTMPFAEKDDRPINNSLFVVTPITETGYTLHDMDEFHKKVATFVVLSTFTNLSTVANRSRQSITLGEPQSIQSFGLVHLKWPGETAVAHAVQQLSEKLVKALRNNSETHTEDGLTSDSLIDAPVLLANAITPPTVALIPSRISQDSHMPEIWELLRRKSTSAHPLILHWREDEARWYEALDQARPYWARLSQIEEEKAFIHLRYEFSKILNMQRVVPSIQWLQHRKRLLDDWLGGVELRQEELADDMRKITSRSEKLWTQLEEKLSLMPELSLKGLMNLFRHPLKLPSLYFQWLQIKKVKVEMVTMQAAELATRIVDRQMWHISKIYEKLIADIDVMIDKVEKIDTRIASYTQPEHPVPDWPDSPLLLNAYGDTYIAAWGEVNFPSSDRILEFFTQEFGSLSDGLAAAMPDVDSVRSWLKRITQHIGCVSVWDVAQAIFTPEDRLRIWVDELMIHASPLIQWDPTLMSEKIRTVMSEGIYWLSNTDQVVIKSWQDKSVDWVPSPESSLCIVRLYQGLPANNICRQALILYQKGE